MAIYALTIFAGAFLLFQVQPLIGKFILPWFGGGPGVWNACLLFFQVVLVGGYAYAHLLTRLKPARQLVVHLVVLGAAVALLPIIPGDQWRPTGVEQPVGRILLLLLATVGLPYFVLSTTGPLLQHWFSRTHPGVSPYRLYALSNVGSLLALLSYPMVFEAQFTRREQGALWGWGLALYAVGCAICAWRFFRRGTHQAGRTTDHGSPITDHVPPSPRPWLWVALPAGASLLLLAVTNKLCLDVASVPFLWVAPLSLYLLSFIISFDSPRWYHRALYGPLFVLALAGFVWAMRSGTDWPVWQQVTLYCGALFACCMVCHGELYRLRPAPERLTGFYLSISVGGALGGLAVAVLAPWIFSDYFELHAGILLCGLLAVWVWSRRPSGQTTDHGSLITDHVPPPSGQTTDCGSPITDHTPPVPPPAPRPPPLAWPHWRPVLAGSVGLAVVTVGVLLWKDIRASGSNAIYRTRNFYGVLLVNEYNHDDPFSYYRLLQHGRITHGLQFMDPDQARWPVSYYAPETGVGVVLSQLSTPRHIGVIGLGTASLLTYGRDEDRFRLYEINPDVDQVARNYFTYLSNSVAPAQVILGDARLVLEREPDQAFDFLVLDAFSSDSIPVHLLTLEAFQLYSRHLKSDGVLVVHISNHFLDLEPVVRRLAGELGYHAVTIDFEEQEERWWLYGCTWMLLCRDAERLQDPVIQDRATLAGAQRGGGALWTDDYSSVFRVLKK